MILINKFWILIIKFYKYFIAPYFPSRCRYLPTCSDYFIESLKLNGSVKGSYLGIKRIFRCHPIKILGGSSGYDPVPNLKEGKK
jgi:putative membrane protein insertion efficiency factor